MNLQYNKNVNNQHLHISENSTFSSTTEIILTFKLLNSPAYFNSIFPKSAPWVTNVTAKACKQNTPLNFAIIFIWQGWCKYDYFAFGSPINLPRDFDFAAPNCKATPKCKSYVWPKIWDFPFTIPEKKQ